MRRRVTLRLLLLAGLLVGGRAAHPLAAQDVRPPAADSLRRPAPAAVDSVVSWPAPDSVAGMLPPPAAVQLRPAVVPDLHDFARADSLTRAYAEQGRWAALDSLGRQLLKRSTDYPALRQRLGYGALQQNRVAAALGHYGHALAADPADEESRSQLAWSYLALSQPGPARLVAAALPDSVRRSLHLPPARALTQVVVEAGPKFSQDRLRGPAGVGRVAVSSQLSARLGLTQALTYYGQTVQLPHPRPTDDPDAGRPTLNDRIAIRQGEYALLLTEQLRPAWQLKGGYHFLRNSFGTARYANHLGYAALRYSRPRWQVQAGFYAGRITDSVRTQTDLQVLAYPLGNLNLYAFARGSLVRSGGHSFPNGLLGVGARVRPTVWLEAFGSPGQVPVLFEADGADVYNLLDPLRYRFGLNAYWQLTNHWQLHLYYVDARFREVRTTDSYNQHSLTGGFAWTW